MPIKLIKAAAPRRKGAPEVARQGKHQLVDTIAEEVSSVDKPAIAEPFYIVKNAAGKAAPKKAGFGYGKDEEEEGKGKKKKPAMKADPPQAEAAPAPEAEAEATTPNMTNAELLQGLGAYVEGLIAIANEVEGGGELEGPVSPEALSAIEEAVSQFVGALGLSVGGAEETEATEEVEAQAPETTKEAAVSQKNSGVAKRSFKLTGDKATRFEVAMELLAGLNFLPGGEEGAEGETQTAPAPAAPAKGKAPAAAPAPAKPAVATKKSEDGEEMPGWARTLAGAVHAIGKEVKAMKRGGSPAPAKKQGGVHKSFGVPNAAPVDGHEEQVEDDEHWPRDLARPRRRYGDR